MKTRSYKELYTLTLKELEDGKGTAGICSISRRLYWSNTISYKEYMKLVTNLAKCKPTKRNKFKDFFNDHLFIDDRWWWKRMEYGEIYRRVRINFVKAIIKTLK